MLPQQHVLFKLYSIHPTSQPFLNINFWALFSLGICITSVLSLNRCTIDMAFEYIPLCSGICTSVIVREVPRSNNNIYVKSPATYKGCCNNPKGAGLDLVAGQVTKALRRTEVRQPACAGCKLVLTYPDPKSQREKFRLSNAADSRREARDRGRWKIEVIARKVTCICTRTWSSRRCRSEMLPH